MLGNNIWAWTALACCWATGALLVRQLLGVSWLRAAAPGWLLGSGLVSLSVFFLHLAGGSIRPGLPILLAVWAGAAIVWRIRRPRPIVPDDAGNPNERPGWLAWGVAAVIGVVAASVLAHALATPEARFDALHNWSFKALSTAVHGRPFQGYWPLPDFPNHVPFLAGAFMALQSFPQETAGHAVLFLFFLACIGTIGQAAQSLSGQRGWEWLMALALTAGIPLLMSHTDQLYADLPLAALHLAAVQMAILWLTGGRRSAAFLSGVFCGLGMWTKTEGVLLAAGVGGALLLAGLARTDVSRAATLKAMALWGAGLLLTGGPWPVYLLLQGVAPGSSGHLDAAAHWDRFPAVFRQTVQALRRRETLASLGALFFFLLGGSRKTFPLYLFLATTIVAGLLHVWLPLLVVPENAFGGWREFMQNGMDRYCMHIAPVMLLSAALVARTGRCGGLDRLLQRLLVRPKRP